ncbi:metallophosphoesterase [Sphingomonas glacialis]|uniref:Metallophosphoesterase n=2 Tax=Sphingomonas glacialis TaxID=658225 RepID=A0A502FFD4_9SPHN|nr:metallophosphoesterase [Sphingomonas glacialis]
MGLAGALATPAHGDTKAPAVVNDARLEAAYVIMGDGFATVRIVTGAAGCPALTIDAKAQPMIVRAPHASLPLRPTASTIANSKPSVFPITVCEASLPPGAKRASVDGRPLPMPRPVIRRIVVIGDTGCRLKASENAYQACNDPEAYPFAIVAAHAAAWHPDLVIHVGDYLYRENPCAPGHAGCAGSPWGYGWDSWKADFFTPGAALLAAAPWTVTRGNHESCERAGQGWWRLLDPRAMQPRHDCNDAADDVTGNYSAPYRVSLGQGAQVVVMDLSHAGKKNIAADDPRYDEFVSTHDALARYARNATFTFATDHYPILGVTIPDGEPDKPPKAGNKAFQSTFGQVDKGLVPAGVDVLLAGHVHLWEHVDYSGNTPSQFIAGFSGTQEDAVPLPSRLPVDTSPLPGVTIRQFDAWTDGFGYMTMERTGARSWKVTVRHADGSLLRRCRIRGNHTYCEPIFG